MKLYADQKNTLFVLFCIKQQGVTAPIPLMDLLPMINVGRQKEMFASNYRISCHTLVKHGLLVSHRNPKTTKLAFSLTEKGTEYAMKIYEERTKKN